MFASPWKDTLIILVIVLLFVGPKRLPALSRSIGESIREFKGGIAQASGPDEAAALPAKPAAEAVPDGGSVPEEAPASGAAPQHTNI